MFVSDYVLNGEGHGQVGQILGNARFDPGMLRPYIDGRHKCVTVNTGRSNYNKKTNRMEPIFENVRVNDLRANGVDMPIWNMTNNATTLRKEEWLELDRVVLRAARYRLRAWADLAAANSFGGFNGMAKIKNGLAA